MSNDKTEALLPCPFCGHDEPSFERLGTPRQSCIVVCGWCGCRHESSDEGDECGRSWNERAALAAAPQAPQALPPLTDDMLRYAMACLGTGSPQEAERFRLFWRFAEEALKTASPQAPEKP